MHRGLARPTALAEHILVCNPLRHVSRLAVPESARSVVLARCAVVRALSSHWHASDPGRTQAPLVRVGFRGVVMSPLHWRLWCGVEPPCARTPFSVSFSHSCTCSNRCIVASQRQHRKRVLPRDIDALSLHLVTDVVLEFSRPLDDPRYEASPPGGGRTKPRPCALYALYKGASLRQRSGEHLARHRMTISNASPRRRGSPLGQVALSSGSRVF